MNTTYKQSCQVWLRIADSKPTHALHCIVYGRYKSTGQPFKMACHFDERLGWVGINSDLSERITHWMKMPEGPE